MFISSQPAWKVNAIIELVVIIFAFIYFYKGCKKDYNRYYKYAMILMLVEYLASYLEGAVVPDYVVATEWWQILSHTVRAYRKTGDLCVRKQQPLADIIRIQHT